MQFRVGIAENTHVEHRTETRAIERLPYAQPLQQRLRARGQRVDARIERRARRQAGGTRRDERGAQAGLRERERGRLADEPAADDDSVKFEGMRSHAGIIAVGFERVCGRDGPALARASAALQ